MSERPNSVKIISAFNFIGGFFYSLLMVYFVLTGGGYDVLGLLTGVLLAIGPIVFAIGLWQLKKWARWMGIILYSMTIVGGQYCWLEGI